MLRILSVLVKQWPVTCDLCFVPVAEDGTFNQVIYLLLRNWLLEEFQRNSSARDCAWYSLDRVASFLYWRPSIVIIHDKVSWNCHESKHLHEISWRLVNKLDTTRGTNSVLFTGRTQQLGGGVRKHGQVEFDRGRNGENITKMTFTALINLSWFALMKS